MCGSVRQCGGVKGWSETCMVMDRSRLSELLHHPPDGSYEDTSPSLQYRKAQSAHAN